MKRIGLSGGISCGKSSVADILRTMGNPVIDAEQVALTIVEKGKPALNELIEVFGSDILDANDSLNRKALGALIMQSPEKRAILNQITHPKIRESIFVQLMTLQQEGHEAAVVEAALMVETKSHLL